MLWKAMADQLEEAYASPEGQHHVHCEITRNCSELLSRKAINDPDYKAADGIATLNQNVMCGKETWQKLHAELLAAAA